MLPGIFESSVLDPHFIRGRDQGQDGGQGVKPTSRFLRPIHPKTEIKPSSAAISSILGQGWVGQLKIHGHRAQIHLPASEAVPILAYNRQGNLHKLALSPGLDRELRRVFGPSAKASSGLWNVIDAEWLKPEGKIFVFDFLKKEGESLHKLNFESRWSLLPRSYLSPHLQTLGLLKTLAQCEQALGRSEKWIEGLVFKSPSPGFEDHSIVRCRR